ncbi:hypothetical protein IPJ70_02595 [Candidatus Campbellbacteria bacterium]|nr:MAG: hypothetical protein IPJ70_02595 [Candidatus Campbellbacteria bacterium]
MKDVLKFIVWMFLAATVVAVLGAYLSIWNLPLMNIQREVVQHSQQYIEAKVSLLQELHNEWLKLESECIALSASIDDSMSVKIMAAKRAQQKALVDKMRSEADLIPESEVPRSITVFLAQNVS